MKIISDASKDTQSAKPKPGSYEWWYFDAKSDAGYSLVVIFYDGNPFSREYIRSLERGEDRGASGFPAISISVYKNNIPIFYCFEEVRPGDASFSAVKPAGCVGGNSFKANQTGRTLNYDLKLNQLMPNGDYLKGKLSFKSHTFFDNGLPGASEGEDSGSGHIWNLVQPRCSVNGFFEIGGYAQHSTEFSGIGYHDHNAGNEPMKESFSEWYWGRYHLKDATFIYYLMLENNIWQKKAWLVWESGEVEKVDESIEMENPGVSVFGLKSFRSISFADNGLKGFLQKDHIIDNGPFYQRFEGRFFMHEGSKVFDARGISEYIKPSRIYNRLFWPLVNMRIRYPGRDHWVQKNPVLYRWTW